MNNLMSHLEPRRNRMAEALKRYLELETPSRDRELGNILASVLAECRVLESVSTPLAHALGAILAADVRAAEPLPPFAASVKDGYAVVAADGPGDYPVVGDATAGRMPSFTVTPGTAAYITTGAPLPPGSDAVVMVEETDPLPARSMDLVHLRHRKYRACADQGLRKMGGQGGNALQGLGRVQRDFDQAPAALMERIAYGQGFGRGEASEYGHQGQGAHGGVEGVVAAHGVVSGGFLRWSKGRARWPRRQ